jgi:glycosyltransferase involved in cell wall biosynthesis
MLVLVLRRLPSRAGQARVGTARGPRVSVVVLTFNHEEYVAQALESILGQKAGFDWEIVVGDDGSTDGTPEILKSYGETHPERLRLLLHPEGLGPYEDNLQGNNNLIAAYRACRGEYVALLSGDDYWTDDRKLDKQVGFLDAHPSCTLCCHAVAVEYSGERARHWEPVIGISPKELCSIEDILRLETKPEMPEPSMMLRRGSLPQLPPWFEEMFNSDYALQVLLAERGSVGFLPDCMAVHRKHSGGASRFYDADPDFCNAMLLKLHVALNRHLGYRYASILDPYIERERLLADAATTMTGPFELGSTVVVPLALEGFVPAAGRLGWEADGSLAIVTAPASWAYGALLALPSAGEGAARDVGAYLCVRARVEGSAVGMGVLSRAGDGFLDRRSLDPVQGEVELRLRIPRLEEAGDLVVQTWADAAPGTVHIESIELVELAGVRAPEARAGMTVP